MGDNTSRDLASAVSEGYALDAVLTAHLRTNHFPALPREFVSVAKVALEKAEEAEPYDGGFFEPEVLEEEIEWPNVGMQPREGRQDEDGKVWSTVRVALDVMHLWNFVAVPVPSDEDEEDEEEQPSLLDQEARDLGWPPFDTDEED